MHNSFSFFCKFTFTGTDKSESLYIIWATVANACSSLKLRNKLYVFCQSIRDAISNPISQLYISIYLLISFASNSTILATIPAIVFRGRDQFLIPSSPFLQFLAPSWYHALLSHRELRLMRIPQYISEKRVGISPMIFLKGDRYVQTANAVGVDICI